ncbi:PilW family protein [Vreelandella sp. EE7]
MRDRRLFLSTSASPPQAGFTLVELLVAMVIGVMVVLGATQLFVASQRSYQITTALANMQDTGRFALETLSRELRQVDFKGGCAGNQTPVHTSVTPAPAIQGYSRPPGSLENALPNTHSIAFRGGLSPDFPQPTPVRVDRFTPPKQLVLLQGPFKCALFQGELPPNLSASDYPESRTFAWVLDSATYYLGTDDDNANAPSLRRVDTSGDRGNEVLASHIPAFRALFLIGDEYLPPEALSADQWKEVRAVRISLIVQSERTGLRQAPTTIATGNFRSNPFNADDGRLYQAFTTTIALRNPGSRP